MSRKVVLYIAMSLDGFIAKKDGDISWLQSVERENQDYGYSGFLKKVDTVLMGRKTYEKVMSLVSQFPHLDRKTYVITGTLGEKEGNPTFYSGEPLALVKELKEEMGGDIFIDGGAELVKTLKAQGLIDEYIISVLPLFLGDGIRLFHPVEKEEMLELMNTRMYESGLIQLRYKVKK